MSAVNWKPYPSYDALVTRALGPSDMETRRRHSRTNSNGWSGGSWDMAQETAPVGDMVGAEKLAPAIVKGANEMVLLASRFDPVYKVEGGRWVDVGRFCSGEPECFVEMEETNQARKKGVAIVFNAIANCDVSAAAMNKIGVIVGETVLGLQAMGHAVALHVAYANEGDELMIDHFPLIGDGMQFDIAKLSAVLRPWFFRRIMFSLWETYDAETRASHQIGGGYGHARSITKAHARAIVGDKTSTVVVVNMHEYAYNADRAKADILTEIKKGE